jgi:hypothetical protein
VLLVEAAAALVLLDALGALTAVLAGLVRAVDVATLALLAVTVAAGGHSVPTEAPDLDVPRRHLHDDRLFDLLVARVVIPLAIAIRLVRGVTARVTGALLLVLLHFLGALASVLSSLVLAVDVATLAAVVGQNLDVSR